MLKKNIEFLILVKLYRFLMGFRRNGKDKFKFTLNQSDNSYIAVFSLVRDREAVDSRRRGNDRLAGVPHNCENSDINKKNCVAVFLGISLSLPIVFATNLSQTSAQSLPQHSQEREPTSTESSTLDRSTSGNTDISNQSTDSEDDSFFNPPPLGAPERTADGGARGDCPVYNDRNQRLTILSPETDPVTIASSTISQYPTVLVYLPEYSGIKSLVLRLLDDREAEIYTDIFPVDGESGIIRFTLPESQFNGLTSGKWYIWHLFVSNSDNLEDIEQIKANTSQCDWVEGLIGRRPLDRDRQQQLNAANNLEDIWNFYAREIIWYDALATLDQMRRENPEAESIQRRWQAFLGLIGLGHLAAYPPVDISDNSQ